MFISDKYMRDFIYTPAIIFLVLLTCFTTFQSSFSQINSQSPFSESNAKIQSVSRATSDGKYFVNLQYAPALLKKGEPTFFMANLFENTGEKQTRMRHVDCDFIIQRNGVELYKMSTKYGEPLFHSISGVMLPSFRFTEPGKYTISVEIAAVFFVPIEPTFANFSSVVSSAAAGNLEIKLST